LQTAGIDVEAISETLYPRLPPWSVSGPEIVLELSDFRKDSTDPQIYRHALRELLQHYPDHRQIFTDGSKSEDGRVAAAAVSSERPRNPFQTRLMDTSSVFTAELQALLLALKHVYQSTYKYFTILSDSLSALQALKASSKSHPLVIQILDLYATLMRDDYDIVFIWVPGHVGIRGNSLADAAAKDARDGQIVQKQTVFSDFKPLINKYVLNQWQAEWNEQEGNKLHEIIPNLRDVIPRCRANRREETVLCRLHIGHTYLTHSYILKGEEPPFCYGCHEPFTVKHFLLSCVELADIRNKFYTAENMKVLFRDVPPDSLFGFLRESNIWSKI
jgi:ribonuclease HI